MNTRDREARVLTGFCRLLPGEWRIESQPDPPDGILRNGDDRVAVELVQYRAQTMENERYEPDDALAQLLHDEWLEDPDVQEFTPFLYYRKDRQGRYRVPRPRDRKAFISELKALVKMYPPPTSDHVMVILIRPDLSEGEELSRSPELRPTVASHSGATLTEYLEKVLLSFHPGLSLGTAHTSLGHSYAWLDSEIIRRCVARKIAKLPDYRSKTEHPIWLVIHSDGWPPSARLLDHFVPEAVRLARETLDQERDGPGFDAVFWYDDVLTISGGRIHAVDGKASQILGGP